MRNHLKLVAPELREQIVKERLRKWRKEGAIVKIDTPTRIARAHMLGYRAKEGMFVVRIAVKRGGRIRPRIKGGRRPRRYGRVHYAAKKSLRWIAEERVSRKHPNAEVVNSYLAAQDGKSKWFEVLLIDRCHPNVKKSPYLKNIAAQRGRVNRGLTPAGRKSRGLHNKGKGAEKLRPSIRSHDTRGK